MTRDDKESCWNAVTSKSDVVTAGLLDVHVGRHVVLLVAVGDEIRAFQGLCPHQHARLSEGSCVDGVLQCPRHLARFNLNDGSCSGGWQLPPLRRYAVRVADGDVLLPHPLILLD